MKLDGATVQFMLAQRFGDVVSTGISRVTTYDYPLLYDVSGDMGGHVVLVPEHERPRASAIMNGVLCVCMGDESAEAACAAGLPVITVKEPVTFQHLYNVMQSVFVQNDRMDAQMRAYVDTHAGFPALLNTCCHTMGLPMVLIDEQYRIVCQAVPAHEGEAVDSTFGERAQSRLMEPELVDLFMASQNYRYKRTTRNVFTTPGSDSLLMKNLFYGGGLVGTLVVQHGGDVLLARFARFLLNYLCPYIEEMYARIGSFDLKESGRMQVRTAIHDIVAGDATGYSKLEVALAEVGRGDCDSYAVVRIDRSFTNDNSDEGNYLARRFEQALPDACCFFMESHLFMLIAAPTACDRGDDVFLHDLPLVARDNLSKAGVSREFSDMGQLRSAWAQASIAFEYGAAERPFHWCYRFDDYVFDWILRNVRQDMPVEYVCHPGVSALLRYDEAHGTELLPTLLEFLRCRYNATQAAEALFIARSTLLHRLERIAEVAHIDLDDFSDRVYLGLSFAMLLGEGRMS